jgi:hypothetical protein
LLRLLAFFVVDKSIVELLCYLRFAFFEIEFQ